MLGSLGELSLFGSGRRSAASVSARAIVRTLAVDQLEERIVSDVGLAATVPAFGSVAWNAPVSHRGFMIEPADFINAGSRAAKISELASWNVNVVRWQMNMEDGRPLADQFRETADRVQAVIADFRRAGIGVILSFHPPIGGVLVQNISRSATAQATYVSVWKDIANRFKNEPGVVGYDVFNEPHMDVAVWSNVARKVVQGIRSIDGLKPIILESAYGDPYKLRHLPIFPAKDKVIYSFHMYAPEAYTHQGVSGRPENVPYSASVQTSMNRALQAARDWQLSVPLANRPRIFVGEFSVARDFVDVTDSDRDGNTSERIQVNGTTEYLTSCINKFEEYRWDWTYHAYDEYSAWDLKNGDPGGLRVIKSRLNQNAAGLADGMTIRLRAYNGMFFAAEGGGGREVVANRSQAFGWETFTVVVLGANRIALRASNGQYLCAEGGGGREVVANRNAIGGWEQFTVERIGGNRIALRAWNGQYLCAEGGGGREVVANRNAIGGWETFEFSRI